MFHHKGILNDNELKQKNEQSHKSIVDSAKNLGVTLKNNASVNANIYDNRYYQGFGNEYASNPNMYMYQYHMNPGFVPPETTSFQQNKGKVIQKRIPEGFSKQGNNFDNNNDPESI